MKALKLFAIILLLCTLRHAVQVQANTSQPIPLYITGLQVAGKAGEPVNPPFANKVTLGPAIPRLALTLPPLVIPHPALLLTVIY